MSIEAMSAVLNSTMTTDPLQKWVLMGLANHADGYGRGARPSQETLARYAQCGRRSVQRKLQELEELGAISRGDQRLTEHLRGDRRPVVWDLNLRALHASNVAHEDEPPRGATVAPRGRARGVTPDAHGASHVAHRTVTRTIPPKSPTTARARRVAELARVAELDGQARRAEQEAAALDRRQRINECRECDAHGNAGGRPCNHEPARVGQVWAGRIRAQLGWISDSQPTNGSTA